MHLYLLFKVFIFFFLNFALAQELDWILTNGSHTPGPNCWNGAMVQAGVLKNHRFIHPLEFQYLLQKNCQSTAEPRSGALGRMWDDRGEVHAFIWVNPRTVYSKHSDGHFDSRGYEFMDMDEMLKSYLFKKECAMNHEGKGCQRNVDYYQCRSPQGPLALQMQALQKGERLLHSLVFAEFTKMSNGDNCQSAGYLNRNQILADLELELQELSKTQIIEATYLDLWLQSVAYQVAESQQNVSVFRCKNIKNEKKVFWYLRVKDWIDQMRRSIQVSGA